MVVFRARYIFMSKKKKKTSNNINKLCILKNVRPQSFLIYVRCKYIIFLKLFLIFFFFSLLHRVCVTLTISPVRLYQCPNDAFLFQFTFYVSKLCVTFFLLHRKLFIFMIIIGFSLTFAAWTPIIFHFSTNIFMVLSAYFQFLFFFSLFSSLFTYSFFILVHLQFSTGWPNAQKPFELSVSQCDDVQSFRFVSFSINIILIFYHFHWCSCCLLWIS